MNTEYDDITKSVNTLASAKMAIGDTIEGKLKGLEVNQKYPDKQNLILVGNDGKELIVFTSGSLTYAVKDGKFEVGRTYRITRLENKITKRGASRTQFQIQRLREDGNVAVPTEVTSAPVSNR